MTTITKPRIAGAVCGVYVSEYVLASCPASISVVSVVGILGAEDSFCLLCSNNITLLCGADIINVGGWERGGSTMEAKRKSPSFLGSASVTELKTEQQFCDF